MIKKLTAIGNSYGLIIDKSILELLEIAPETDLDVSTDGERLIIEPVRSPGRRRRLARPRSVAWPPATSRPGHGFPKKPPW
jgi:antitoxin component of MazEF toxin-antitoxin module